MSSKPFYLAVRGILFNEQGQVLLMQRAATCKHQPGFWEFPGGKVDPGEAFADALVREFKEETGFDVELKQVLSGGQWEREPYMIAYLFMLVEKTGGQLAVSREHDDAAWMDANVLTAANVSPQLKALQAQVLKLMTS